MLYHIFNELQYVKKKVGITENLPRSKYPIKCTETIHPNEIRHNYIIDIGDHIGVVAYKAGGATRYYFQRKLHYTVGIKVKTDSNGKRRATRDVYVVSAYPDGDLEDKDGKFKFSNQRAKDLGIIAATTR